jgi:hypothetical protein
MLAARRLGEITENIKLDSRGDRKSINQNVQTKHFDQKKTKTVTLADVGVSR